MRTCSKCKKKKPIDQFTGTQVYCKQCRAEYNRQKNNNLEYKLYRRFYLLSKVLPNLTLGDVVEFHKRFTGRCDICGREIEGRSKHLDHDSETQTLRGWLCDNCNMGLGKFQHNPQLLMIAASYLGM